MVVVYVQVCSKILFRSIYIISLTFNRLICLNRGSV